MISHPHKTIFVHLRRTAGNAIEMALGGIQLLDAQGNPTTTWVNDLHRGKTPHKRDLRGHYIHASAPQIKQLHPDEFATYFKFSIIRNPWEQMLSLYLRLNPQDPTGQHFPLFIDRFSYIEGTVPYASLFDEKGKSMMNFIGRFEDLQRDFDRICDTIGITPFNLPHANASSNIKLNQAYTPAAMDKVAQLYAEDIELFGYTYPG